MIIEQRQVLKTKVVSVTHVLNRVGTDHKNLLVANSVSIKYRDNVESVFKGHTATRSRKILVKDAGDPSTLLLMLAFLSKQRDPDKERLIFIVRLEELNTILGANHLGPLASMPFVLPSEHTPTGTTSRYWYELREFKSKFPGFIVSKIKNYQEINNISPLIATNQPELAIYPQIRSEYVSMEDHNLTQKTFDRVFPKKFRYSFFANGGN